MKLTKILLLLFIGAMIITVALARGGKGGGGSGSNNPATKSIILSVPFGQCQQTYRYNRPECCIFDPGSPNSINSIGSLDQLIGFSNPNNFCNFRTLLPFPGGNNC